MLGLNEGPATTVHSGLAGPTGGVSVDGSILFGLDVTPLGIGMVGLFGLLMGAVGYFVARLIERQRSDI